MLNLIQVILLEIDQNLYRELKLINQLINYLHEKFLQYRSSLQRCKLAIPSQQSRQFRSIGCRRKIVK